MALKVHHSLARRAGEWLKTQDVEPLQIDATDLAARSGVSPRALSGLLNRHAGLSADMAIRLEKASGTRADTPMRVQTALAPAHSPASQKGPGLLR